MACGDRYRKLVVTSDGYTLDDPFGLIGIYPYDYVQWKDLARKLVHLATSHYRILGDYEAQISNGTHHPKWNDLIPIQNGMIAVYDELPSGSLFMSGAEGEEGISQAQDAIAQALCLLELSDDALASYGERPPEIPGLLPKPRGGFPWWGWVLIGGGTTIALGAYVSHRQKRNRLEPPKEISRQRTPGQAIARRPTVAKAESESAANSQ